MDKPRLILRRKLFVKEPEKPLCFGDLKVGDWFALTENGAQVFEKASDIKAALLSSNFIKQLFEVPQDRAIYRLE